MSHSEPLDKIRTGMIEMTYAAYQNWKNDPIYEDELSNELNKDNDVIPVWRDMNDNTKCAAIEYVYNNRDSMELHDGVVQSWVQATVYFMLYNFLGQISDHPDLDMFFDDFDFMMDEDTLTDPDVIECLGIDKDFTGSF